MSYYFADEMKQVLNDYPQYKEKLYCRGFLITNDRLENLNEYPFYSNWNCITLNGIENTYNIYTHKEIKSYVYEYEDKCFFIVGHAYDPFNMRIKEEDILKDLAIAFSKSERDFWDAESNLTGVFCVGYLDNDKMVYATDCAGMQLVYHGTIKNKLYVTSHSKLVADLLDLRQTEYVERLVNNKFWHYWGTWLPGDLSPYKELRRMQPNFEAIYNGDLGEIRMERFYPLREVVETATEDEYQETIKELGKIMSNTMYLIGQKWSDKKVSISVTGGRDSMTALSCTNGNYDKFTYFSYISNVDESVDAYAAKDILKHLGLEHEIFEIPEEYEEYNNIEAFKKVMQCNAGCIGENNLNDVKKRLYFSKKTPCDVEVKSWVNEMGRGWYYNKYNKKSFPKYPTPSYWRCMHKAYINDLWLIKETDKVFKEYLDKYYSKEVFDRLSWLELYFWEFAWSGGEGVFLTSEHRVSYDITIPFNNRKYIEKMLTVPIEKRKKDCIPNDLITYMEPRIAETGIVIKDISHTNMRALLVRVYLEIFSKLQF